MINRGKRYWNYFRKGWLEFLSFFIGISNFIVLQDRIVSIALIVFGIPLAVLIGWWAFNRGTMITQSVLISKNNPYNIEFQKAEILTLMGMKAFSEGNQELAKSYFDEAIEIRERWL